MPNAEGICRDCAALRPGLRPTAYGLTTNMKHLMLEEIRRAVKGRWRVLRADDSDGSESVRRRGAPATVGGVSTDSRNAGADDLFVALRGEKFDGHDFLADAASAGCAAAVVDMDAPLEPEVMARFDGGVIGVADTTSALGDLAAYYRRELAATVVAVTGSNGKTTVKGMIHHILSTRLKGIASPASYNNAVGVPITLLSASADDEYVICEVGSNAPGEIANLARIARPDIAVITSVAAVHLAGLGDLGRVAVEKASLLGGLSQHGLAVVPVDSDPLATALRAYDARQIRFGDDDSAELRLTGYEPVGGGGRFELNGRIWVDLGVPGRHNVLNALAAIAVAQRFGFDQDAAAAALGDYRGQPMRLQPIRAGTVTIVNDAYNANPASLKAAAEALASFPGDRRVVVIGDMLELGPQSEQMHRSAGEALAKAGVNLIVGVGLLGRCVAAGAGADGNVRTEQIESVSQACTKLPKLLEDGDVVLLKGSRLMGMERLVAPISEAFEKSRKAKRTAGKQKTTKVKRTVGKPKTTKVKRTVRKRKVRK